MDSGVGDGERGDGLNISIKCLVAGFLIGVFFGWGVVDLALEAVGL